jgi:hypothetical protein
MLETYTLFIIYLVFFYNREIERGYRERRREIRKKSEGGGVRRQRRE